jgi:4-hydroxybenzoate polyprenyltransferase
MKVSEQRPLRSIPLLKVFLIAAVWTMATIYLVIIHFDLEFQGTFHLLASALFLFMIAEIIPFDIRDITIDENDNVQTIPSQLGIRSSIYISLLILLASNVMMLSFFEFQLDGHSTLIFLSWMFSSIYLAICLLYSRKKREDLFYSLIIEISLLLPWCFTQLLEVI